MIGDRFLAKLPSEATQDSDSFREQTLYTEACDRVFQASSGCLDPIECRTNHLIELPTVSCTSVKEALSCNIVNMPGPYRWVGGLLGQTCGLRGLQILSMFVLCGRRFRNDRKIHNMEIRQNQVFTKMHPS